MISLQQEKNDFLADHFADAGKMVDGGKCASQGTMEIDDYF